MKVAVLGNGSFLIQLQAGESVQEKLRLFALENQVKAGFITGIGAISDPELGYFDIHQKKYLSIQLDGSYEVLSLNGNLSEHKGEPFFHIHVSLADKDFSVKGGHLFDAKVSVTLELIFQKTNIPLSRSLDDQTGLNLWKLP